MTGVDDEFDHDEPTNVEDPKEPENLSSKLALHEAKGALERLNTLEKDLNGLRELVVQVIERNEQLTREVEQLRTALAGSPAPPG